MCTHGFCVDARHISRSTLYHSTLPPPSAQGQFAAHLFWSVFQIRFNFIGQWGQKNCDSSQIWCKLLIMVVCFWSQNKFFNNVFLLGSYAPSSLLLQNSFSVTPLSSHCYIYTLSSCALLIHLHVNSLQIQRSNNSQNKVLGLKVYCAFYINGLLGCVINEGLNHCQ